MVQKMYMVCMPFFLLGGTIGNILSFAVIVRKEMRNLSSSLYLALLAVADTIHIWTWGLWYFVVSVSDLDLSKYTNCKLDYFLHTYSHHYSAWLLVSVTIERFICVYFPFKVKFWCTTKNAKIVCSILAVVLAGVNFPQFLARYMNNDNGCTPYPRYEAFILFYWPYIDLVLYSFLPSLVMGITNGLIVFKMKKSSCAHNHVQYSAMAKNSQKITVMLITVSTSFICLTLPVEGFTIYVERTSYNFYLDNIWFALVNVLKYLNHSINFFLYIVSAEKFRIELKKMMCKGTRVGQGNETISGSTDGAEMTDVR